jgi:CheY-like chemotaxis protein
MKLDYKILWLDDKMEVILEGGYDAEIKDFLVKEGFNPIIVTVKNEKEFFENLNDSYDLIMTDYHLNEKEGATRDGDTIIKEVRENNSIFTEIMFYSAQGEVVDTVKLDRITFVDTRKILGSDHYEKLIGKALILIQLTVKKFQHIVAMRGMIMNETSGLDMQMLDIIKKTLGNDKVNFDELASKIYDELNQLYSSKSKFVDECRDSGKFKLLAKDTFVFSAEYKIKTLGQILNSLHLDDFSEEYKEEINSIRNKFAHAILLKDENGREYFKHGESGITFDQDLCRKIRVDIIKHKHNFDKLKSALD